MQHPVRHLQYCNGKDGGGRVARGGRRRPRGTGRGSQSASAGRGGDTSRGRSYRSGVSTLPPSLAGLGEEVVEVTNLVKRMKFAGGGWNGIT